MTAVEIALLVVSVLLCVSLYYTYRFARIILSLEDRIEAALDDLDKRYTVMSEILSRPVFFDSVEVRKVVSEIGECRETILKIANGIARLEVSDERDRD
jgi:hypothetical protein